MALSGGAWAWPIRVPVWEKKLGGRLKGLLRIMGGEDYVREVGGVFVYVGGQEVLHGCGVEHGDGGCVRVRMRVGLLVLART